MDEGQSNQCMICLQIRNARGVEPEVPRCMFMRPATYKGKFASVVASVATIDVCERGGIHKYTSLIVFKKKKNPATSNLVFQAFERFIGT